MKKLFPILYCLFTGIVGIFAQEREVRGVVLSTDNAPVIQASVVVSGQRTIGTSTDRDGNFVLKVPANAKFLEVSYVGMTTQTVAIEPVMRIVLEPDTKALDEVVVIAYGTAKKQSLVGAQASVSARQLEKRPITNVSNALSALAPGVQVTTSTGQPGASSSIRIRGFGSINASSSPLYIVDGSIYNGAISDIAPQDIQSISILKDAASTALYGSSAGNGVIMITTKSGATRGGGKPSFNLTINQGASRKGQKDYDKVGIYDFYPMRWLQWFNEYKYDKKKSDDESALYANYLVFNDLKYNPYAGIKSYYEEDPETGEIHLTQTPNPQAFSFPQFVMPDGTLNPEVNGLLWGDDLDWEKDLFKTGYRQEYILSGGLNTDKSKSYISVGWLDEDGYKIKTNLTRFSSRANLTYEINKYLTVGSNSQFTKTHIESPKRAEGNYSSNSFHFVRNIAPIYPIHVHDAQGNYVLKNGEKIYDHASTRPYNGKFNPIEESYLDKSYAERDAITSRNFAEIKALPELTFRTNLSYDLYRATEKIRYNNSMGDQPQGMLEIENQRITTVTFNQLVTYRRNFDAHRLEALLGHESYEMKQAVSTMNKENMAILGIDEMPNLSKMSDINSKTDTYTKEGYFARLNYDYGDRYNLSASYRRDGSSRFHKDNRWGDFWSVGAGWHLANESFMKGAASWLNELKLRFSIGQTGNDRIGTYYAYQSLYILGNNNFETLGARFSSLGNPDLKWETQTSYDFAVEFGLFGRLRGSVEFFNKESKDLIFSFPLPISTGVSSVFRNIGKVRNYGFEFDLKYEIIRRRTLSWDVNVNGTTYKNKIIRLPEENREKGIELTYKKYVEGGSIQDFYLNEYIGVDPDDGLAIYRIDDINYPKQADPSNPNFVGMEKEGEKATWTKDGRFAKKHFCGSSIPNLYGGFGTNVSFKGFDLNMLFAYQLGGKTYDGAYQILMGRSLSSGLAMHSDMKKAWRKPGDITNIPRLDSGSSGRYDNLTSDRYLISSSALMLKSLSIGYSFPQEWISPFALSGLRCSIACENLFLLSKRKGLNPMMNYAGTTGSAFYDYQKVITASVSISF